MNKRDLFKILNAYFCNKQFNTQYNEADFEEILAFTREQSLSQFLYPVIKHKTFKKDYISATINQEAFIQIQNELNQIFNDSGIPHAFFKGSVLYELYDDKALRTRGDIDLIVFEKDYLKARNVLIDNGYINHDDIVCEHHMSFSKGKYEVELHRALFDEDEGDKYFDNVFTCLQLKDKYLYEFPLDLHFIYVLYHYVIHLKTEGAGVRPIIDLSLMMRKYKISNGEALSFAKRVGLEKFMKAVINVSSLIFDDVECYEDINTNSFIEYILNSGIHGHSEDNELINNIKLVSKKKSKFGFIMSKIFPSPSYLKNAYPRCGRHPILLPFYWFRNLFRLIFKRGKKAITLMKVDTSKNDQIKQMFKEVGLD